MLVITGTGRLLAAGAAAALVLARMAIGCIAAASSGRRDWSRVCAAAMAAGLERLGGVFPKVGQALSARTDLLPAAWCQELARLQDAVAPMVASDVARVLRDLDARAVLERMDANPLASGSIAQVHRALPRSPPVPVALKIKRAGVEARLAVDLQVVAAAARMVAWCLPRSMPVREAVDLVCDSIRGQCDFDREARVQERCARALAGARAVVVPRVLPHLCSRDVIAMELVEGARRLDPRDPASPRAVIAALRAHYHLLFRCGIAHCDLHPGNVLIAPDGRVVLLDFGFAGVIDDAERLAFAEFFVSIVTGDTVAAADQICAIAEHVPARLDQQGFRAAIADAIVEVQGQRAGDFSVGRFVWRLFAIQDQFDILASRWFTHALLSLLMFEGMVKAFCPRSDFQREAMPFLLEALGAAEGA